MSWFDSLMGFAETRQAVRDHITVQGSTLRSAVNGRSYGCGHLTMPSLAELRDRQVHRDGQPTIRQVVGDVQTLHADPSHARATFQAASQFNLLEMASPGVTPDAGVSIYEHDRTQGPACAIAAGAGTIYRNYFVPLGDQLGQTASRQVDCLAEVGRLLGNAEQRLWTMRNGYALLTEAGLSMELPDPDAIRQALRIGLHADVEVTLPGARGQHVSQVYGSAMPIAYGRAPASAWEPLARLVLEASYEATLLAAAEQARTTGQEKVFLTLLGGGVFGNQLEWIVAAMERALATPGLGPLDVAVVSHGHPRRQITEWLAR